MEAFLTAGCTDLCVGSDLVYCAETFSSRRVSEGHFSVDSKRNVFEAF